MSPSSSSTKPPPLLTAEAMAKEVEMIEIQMDALRTSRAEKVGAMTRMAEKLEVERLRRLDAEARTADYLERIRQLKRRREAAEEGIEFCRRRIPELQDEVTELQAAPLEPNAVEGYVAPEARALASRANEMEQELETMRSSTLQGRSKMEELQRRQEELTLVNGRLRRSVRTLHSVYDKVDSQMAAASLQKAAASRADPAEAAVLSLVKSVLPLVPFGSAAEAIADLRSRSSAQCQRPALLPPPPGAAARVSPAESSFEKPTSI